jgi:hypothetical protein
MTKFSTRNDRGYKKVTYAIEMVLEDTIGREDTTNVPGTHVQGGREGDRARVGHGGPAGHPNVFIGNINYVGHAS